MKNWKMTVAAAAVVLVAACGTTRTVPLTGRTQKVADNAQILSLSLNEYQSYMKTAKKSTNAQNTAMVERVGKRLATAVENYLRQNGYESELQGYQWEFNLVKDNQINAFCMPGGKIVVYEGIMNLISSDDELATVLGHEVAHAVAKHSNERMSQQLLAQYGAQALGSILQNQTAQTQQIAQQVYGLGANYAVMLPFSRKHEMEADDMGLVLMAIAGYNLDAALNFWQKMAASSGNSGKSDIASTHPSDAKRIANLQKKIPEVKKQYAGK